MMRERHFFCRSISNALVLAVTILLYSSYLFAAESQLLPPQQSSGGQIAHKFVSLTYIPAEQGKKYLRDLKLGTVSKMPNTNALLVTGQPQELAKAVAVLRLVDAKEQFVIRAISPASAAKSLPPNKQIAAAAGHGLPRGMSIGDFSNPPVDTASVKAIIDIHNDEVLAIAPASQIEKILSAIKSASGGQTTDVQKLVPSPVEVTEDRGQLVRRSLGEDGKSEDSLSGVAPVLRSSSATEGGLAKTEGQKTEDRRQKTESLTSFHSAAQGSETERITFQPKPVLKIAPNMIGGRLSDPNFSTMIKDNSQLAEEQIYPYEEPRLDFDEISRAAATQSKGLNVKTMPVQADSDANYDNRATTRSYEPEPIPNGNETITLNLPDKVDIVHLLGLAGQYLNLDFMYDPAKVKGDVTLLLAGKLRGPIQVNDLYPLMESVLKFKGFVMTRHKGNLVTVVPKEEVLDIDPKLLDAEKGKIEPGDIVITRVFELQYISTDSAENLLKNMQLAIQISSIPEAKTLIVTGFAYRMPRIETLINMVDKPGKPRIFRFRQLQYTMAKTLAPKIQTLAEQLGSMPITIGIESTIAIPTVRRLPNESEANYQRRVAAAKQAAMQRAQPTVKPAMTELTQPTVYLDADERTNRILMIGLQEQLDIVDELIDTLDVEQQDLRTLEIYKIKYVDAEEVRKKLAELGIITTVPETTFSRTTTTITKMSTKPPIPPTITTESPTTSATTQEPLVEEPQVVVIESTNSLLVNATDEQHARIAAIIAYVDSQMEAEEIPYQLYPLENQSPGHLAEILQSLIQETIQQDKDKEGKIEKTVIKREEDIFIVPDPNTFSLIVYANKKNQEWIASLIEKLDKRRPQVLIDVTLVEVSKSDAFNYELNALSSFPDLTDTSGLTGAILPNPTGGNLVSRLTNSSRDRFIDLQSNSGSGTGFYGDRHINALLTAIQEKNYGRILAKPKILVNDNMPGTISTTDRTFVTRTSSIPVTSGAAGQQTTLIQTAEEFEGFDAGITLEITPHISKGDLLRLDINLTRSDFGTITGDKPPDTTTSEINTTVTVPDGSTIILGGLLKLNQSKGGTKIPLLGDIPLVGGLFRGISNSDIQKKLYVFVKAEVIRPEDTAYAISDLKRISERNRKAFEQHEGEFQKYQDWPGIKPKPIDPSKVLDAE